MDGDEEVLKITPPDILFDPDCNTQLGSEDVFCACGRRFRTRITGLVQCDVCGKLVRLKDEVSWSSSTGFISHICSECAKKPIPCRICGKEFDLNDSDSGPPFFCPECYEKKEDYCVKCNRTYPLKETTFFVQPFFASPHPRKKKKEGKRKEEYSLTKEETNNLLFTTRPNSCCNECVKVWEYCTECRRFKLKKHMVVVEYDGAKYRICKDCYYVWKKKIYPPKSHKDIQGVFLTDVVRCICMKIVKLEEAYLPPPGIRLFSIEISEERAIGLCPECAKGLDICPKCGDLIHGVKISELDGNKMCPGCEERLYERMYVYREYEPE